MEPLTLNWPVLGAVATSLCAVIVALYRAQAVAAKRISVEHAELVRRVRVLEDDRAAVQKEQAQRYHDLVLKQLASQHALTEVLKSEKEMLRQLIAMLGSRPCLRDEPMPQTGRYRNPATDDTAIMPGAII
jgi:hypothetical protein